MLHLTLPGLGGSQRSHTPATWSSKTTPKQDAEKIFKKAVSPNVANTGLYYAMTRQAARSQDRVMAATTPDAAPPVVAPGTGTGLADKVSQASPGGGSVSFMSKMARALKTLTGM